MTDAQTDLVHSLRATPTLLRAIVRGVDPAAAGQADAGDWSIVVVVAHLADVDDVMVARMRRILAETAPVIPDYDPEAAVADGTFQSLSLEDALERFEQARARYVAVLEELEPRDWFRPVIHETDGAFTVETFTARMIHHDIAHLAQIAERLR